MFSRRSIRTLGGCLLVGIFVLITGCGPNYKARATVKGKVTFRGTPLPVGNVIFTDKNYVQGSTSIEDGVYELKDAPIGDVRISVTVPKPPPGGMGMLKSGPAMRSGAKDEKSVDPSGSGKSIPMVGKLPDKIVPIPEKYASPETSGLTYTVQKGEHVFDIDLK